MNVLVGTHKETRQSQQHKCDRLQRQLALGNMENLYVSLRSNFIRTSCKNSQIQSGLNS